MLVFETSKNEKSDFLNRINLKKNCLRQGSNQGPSAPYPTALSITPRGRNEKFAEKKKFSKLKWQADWGPMG